MVSSSSTTRTRGCRSEGRRRSRVPGLGRWRFAGEGQPEPRAAPGLGRIERQVAAHPAHERPRHVQAQAAAVAGRPAGLAPREPPEQPRRGRPRRGRARRTVMVVQTWRSSASTPIGDRSTAPSPYFTALSRSAQRTWSSWSPSATASQSAGRVVELERPVGRRRARPRRAGRAAAIGQDVGVGSGLAATRAGRRAAAAGPSATAGRPGRR